MEIEEINPQITNGNSTADPSNGADNPRELTPTRRACHPDFVKFVGKDFERGNLEECQK